MGGAPVMLLRNMDYTHGLCNGTRIVITEIGRYVLHATILAGKFAG
ncbi:hypothetical protein IMZ48_21485 [Candidatus Bathyarchaeota archaeon]|nr:hypothetical protein [Candidatus Bathyarchaeota archaeon]